MLNMSIPEIDAWYRAGKLNRGIAGHLLLLRVKDIAPDDALNAIPGSLRDYFAAMVLDYPVDGAAVGAVGSLPQPEPGRVTLLQEAIRRREGYARPLPEIFELPLELTPEALIADYEASAKRDAEQLYRFLMVRARDEDAGAYLNRIPSAYRAGFANAVRSVKIGGTVLPTLVPQPLDNVVLELRSALAKMPDYAPEK